MRLALVVHDFDPAFGQGRYAVELARRLAPQHEVHVWANTFAPVDVAFTRHHVPAWRRTALGTILTFLAAAEARLRGGTYDLVHAQGLTCWRADVITAHICNGARHGVTPTAGWRQGLFPRVVPPLERGFYRQPQARHLIAVSNRVARQIREQYGWVRPMTVVYHGTDTALFAPATGPEEQARWRAEFGLSATAWVWLFVGEAVKGLAQVIGALPAFPTAELLVVSRSGLGPYRRLAAERAVAPRVRFHGPCRAIATAYKAADVLTYPSGYDAFGLVVAEAMASGLAVVVGEETGAAEWIEPGRNGLLCPAGAPESLHAHLAWLQEDRRRGPGLGRAARATVCRHDWDACAAQTLAVYESVVGRRG